MTGKPQPPDDAPPRRHETREELLAWDQPFPPYPELVIDDLTDEEGEAFLQTLREA